jgi:hypothetical protein
MSAVLTARLELSVITSDPLLCTCAHAHVWVENGIGVWGFKCTRPRL